MARMLEPLVKPVPDQVPDAFEADQVVLRCLLARVEVLQHGDATRALALLKPFKASATRARLAPAVRAEVALWLGWIHAWPTDTTYDDVRALHLLDEADRLFDQTMNPAGRCWALMGKTWAYFALDEFLLMQRALHEASTLQEKIDDAQAARWMLDLRLLDARFQGRYSQALTWADALKEKARQEDDAFAWGRACAYQAALYYDLGRPPAAILATATEAETHLQRLPGRPGYPLLTAYLAHAEALIRQGAWSRADDLFETALDATSDLATAAPHLLLHRALLDLHRSDFDRAEAHLRAAEAQIRPQHHRLLAARAALTRSALHEQQQAFTEAQTWAERAHAMAQETGHPGQQIEALLTLVRLSLAQGNLETAHHHLSRTQPFGDHFGVLPMAALRFCMMGIFALAEDNDEEARPYFAQALSAYSLIGDAYQTARLQERLARLEPTQRPDYARTLHETTFGASLAHAALSIDLVAEAWLQAARPLLPDRWMGVYRCEEGHPWMCVRELGEAPTVPTTHEPCGPRLQNDDVYWIRLRSHPGPAFFFGVALPDPDDPAWTEAVARMKPWLPVASLALDHALLRSEYPGLSGSHRDGPGTDPSLSIQGLVYASPAMRRVVAQLLRTRASHSPVLLTGERGTGKALLARAVHDLSPRKTAPFLTVECANVAEDVVETALFGTRDGGPGRLAAADGGTLYLADIDALPLSTQRTLLQFLLGGLAASLDVRLVASTPRDLGARVQEKRFLEDLYFRLNVIPLPVPPLRERREEIPLLVQHFLTELRPPGTSVPTLTHRAAEALLHYAWPGNVRQLRNEIERVLVYTRSDPAPLIDVEDFSPAFVAATSGGALPDPLQTAPTAPVAPLRALDKMLADTEKHLIEQALMEHEGHVTASANALGLTRQGLYKKMKRLDIDASKYHA